MSRAISNSDDVIDSRDVIARIEELEGEAQNAADHIAECETELAEIEALEETTISIEDRAFALRMGIEETQRGVADAADELKALKSLADDLEGYGDWSHGETLIRDSYFENYARELTEDLGMLRGVGSWLLTCIDWERVAKELQYDYTSAEFDGVTYWMRS